MYLPSSLPIGHGSYRWWRVTINMTHQPWHVTVTPTFSLSQVLIDSSGRQSGDLSIGNYPSGTRTNIGDGVSGWDLYSRTTDSLVGGRLGAFRPPTPWRVGHTLIERWWPRSTLMLALCTRVHDCAVVRVHYPPFFCNATYSHRTGGFGSIHTQVTCTFDKTILSPLPSSLCTGDQEDDHRSWLPLSLIPITDSLHYQTFGVSLWLGSQAFPLIFF